MFSLPLGMMNQAYREKLQKTINEVLDVNVDKEGMGWGPYLKIKVWVNIFKHLIRGSLINLAGNQLWISLKCERLPNFFFKYSIIRHSNIGSTKGMLASKIHDNDLSQCSAWHRALTQSRVERLPHKTQKRKVIWAIHLSTSKWEGMQSNNLQRWGTSILNM